MIGRIVSRGSLTSPQSDVGSLDLFVVSNLCRFRLTGKYIRGILFVLKVHKLTSSSITILKIKKNKVQTSKTLSACWPS